jgi:hypothetical protein
MSEFWENVCTWLAVSFFFQLPFSLLMLEWHFLILKLLSSSLIPQYQCSNFNYVEGHLMQIMVILL